MGPPLNESEEVGFDQNLIKPSASSTLTRRPPDRALDGFLLAVACRASKRRCRFITYQTYFGVVDGISGINFSDHPLRRRRLRSPETANASHTFALFAPPSTVNEGVGFAPTEPCDECSQMLKIQKRLWS